MHRELLERLTSDLFVGREAPLALLEAGLARARQGRAAWLLLTGEAGIGKTRTAEELAARAARAGFAVHAGRFPETEGAPPYRPWVQLLRSLRGSLGAAATREVVAGLGADAPPLATLLPELAASGSPPASPGEGPEARFRLFESVAAFLRAAAARAPRLLLFDDLQGADEASLALLAFCAREVADAPLCVVATRREPAAPGASAGTDATRAALARAFEELPLAPFGADEVRAFFRALTGREPADAFVEAVRERTDGSPLFVTELARLLALRERLDPADASSARATALHGGAREVLRERLAGVSPACRRALACASVLGRDVRRDLFERVLDEALAPSAGALLDEAIAARLLVALGEGGDAFRFAHARIRELLDAELALDDRARLHARAARALEALHPLDPTPVLTALAHHFRAAASVEGPAVAAHFATLAGRDAARRLAFDDARSWLGSALELLDRVVPAGAAAARDRDRRACAVQVELARATERAGDAAEARALYREAAAAADRLGDGALLARAALGFAGEHMGTATHAPDPERVRLLERALESLGNAGSGARVPLLGRLAIELHWAPDPARRDALAAEAVALARASGDATLLAQALVGAVWATWGPDNAAWRRDAASEVIESEPAVRDPVPVVSARVVRAVAQLELGDAPACDADVAAGARLAAEQRLGVLAQFFDAIRTMRVLLDGRLVEGEALANETLARGRRLGSPHSPGVHASHLALIRTAQGRAAELVPLFAAFAERARHPIARATLVWLRVHAGQDAEARRELRALLAPGLGEIPRDFFWLGCIALCAESAAVLAERRAARALYAALLPYAGRTVVVGMSAGCLGSAARPLGLLAASLGRYDAAAEHFEAAAESDARLGAWLFLADTQEAFAAMLRERDGHGDLERAEKLEDEARSLRVERGVAEAAAAARGAPPRGADSGAGRLAATRDGWLVAFGDAEARVPESRGMRYLALLLERPDEELHVLDLVAWGGGDEGARERVRGQGAVVDERARREYRARVQALRAELDRAERENDAALGARARAELDAIERTLAEAFGLGGRARRLGDPVERARKAVYNRLKDVVGAVEEALPPLGRHLARSVRTGTYCAYRPDRPIAWRIERER